MIFKIIIKYYDTNTDYQFADGYSTLSASNMYITEILSKMRSPKNLQNGVALNIDFFETTVNMNLDNTIFGLIWMFAHSNSGGAAIQISACLKISCLTPADFDSPLTNFQMPYDNMIYTLNMKVQKNTVTNKAVLNMNSGQVIIFITFYI